MSVFKSHFTIAKCCGTCQFMPDLLNNAGFGKCKNLTNHNLRCNMLTTCELWQPGNTHAEIKISNKVQGIPSEF